MHLLHAPILIVLLLIPNTTWRDWQSADAPRLRQIVQSGAIALMNSRTAETDTATPEAGIRTILAGARMYASARTSGLEYPALDCNLVKSLRADGISVVPLDATTADIIGPGVKEASSKGELAIKTLPSAIADDDAKIGQAQRMVIEAGGMLAIASPNPSPLEYKAFDQLTPIVVWRPGMRASLLYSQSTHHAGLVTNTDIAPTLAAAAGVTLDGPVYGSPITLETASRSLDRWGILQRISRRSIDQSNNQLYVPLFAAGLAILIALLNVGLLADRKRLTLGMTAGMGFLCSGLLACATAGQFVLLCLVFLPVMYFGVKDSCKWPAHLNSGLAATILIFIALDAAIGHCAVSAGSLLGYTPAEGARYYGLGNEAMGVVIGAATVASVSLLGRRNGLAGGIVLWLIVAGMLGIPTIGAKAGGLLAASIALAAYIASGASSAKIPRRVTGAIAVCVSLAIGLGALVLMGRYSQSHVSQTIGQARDFGTGILWSVAQRKAAMDFHLTFHSTWMLVLSACVIGSWLLARKSNWAVFRRPQAKRLAITGAVATAACLVLNDAGVVAAAMCAVFVWSRLAIEASSIELESTNEEASNGAVEDRRRRATAV